MSNQFQPLDSVDSLRAALDQAQTVTVVLFNHDPWCPISARAHREMSAVSHPIHLIDVSRHRDITAELARATGIRHESPQAFVLRNGQVDWSASHGSITARAVAAALDSKSSLSVDES